MHDRVAAGLLRIFPGDGEMAQRMRAMDWSSGSLGPVENWPDNLRLVLPMCLLSRSPMYVLWGPERLLFYNDAYIPFMEPAQHPAMLGRAAPWAAAERDAALMFVERSLPQEEVYVSLSFSPVPPAADGAAGLYCVCHEVTDEIVAARRLETLCQLGQLEPESGLDAASRQVLVVMARNPRDLPLAAIYLFDEAGRNARLAAQFGLDMTALHLSPDDMRPQADVRELDLESAGLFTEQPWPLGARKALTLPLRCSGPAPYGMQAAPDGLLLVGVGMRRPLDAEYRAFLELVAGKVATVLAASRPALPGSAGALLSESEMRFRVLQQAAPDAFLIFEAERDAAGAVLAFDCEFANPAATRILGKAACSRLTGRNEDGLNQLFGTLVGVMQGERPWQGEHPYVHHGATRWLRSMAVRTGERVALSCTDITAHHAAEVAIRQSEARQSFLLALSDNLRPLSCPRRIMEVACAALGRQLKIAAVGYAEMQADGETLVDSGSYGDGRLPGLPGLTCKLSELAPAFRRALSDGRARFVPDLRRAPIERAGRAGGIYGRGVRATAAAPLIKDGKLVACLYAADAVPRAWSAQDRNLMREIADRTWTAVERARAEQALAVELKGMGRLHEMRARLVKAKDLGALLLDVLDTTIEMHGAFAGSLQLFDQSSGTLRLAAMRGFPPDFEREFRDVSLSDPTPCAQAMLGGCRVVVADVEQPECDPVLRAIAHRAGFRAVQSTPLLSHSGEVIGMLNTHFGSPRHFSEQELRLTDLCARHAADAIAGHQREQMQMRTSEVLESRVNERTGELEHALDALSREALERQQAEDRLRQSEKLKAIGQLTGGIAHDFNNMLQTISSGLNLVRLRVQQGKTGEIEGYLRRAEKGAQRAAALTHRLLAFSRQQTLDPKSVSLGRIAREMEDMIRRAVGPSVQVDLQLSAGKWLVMCDPNQMESALLNLCVNARDAMPDGGWLTISTDEVEFDGVQAAHIEGASAGRYAAISVSDTGHGMAPEVMAHVFEPFFTTKPLGKGTGLGLSQIYGFVRQSGGFVQIESTPGKGTMVRVCLPYNATDPDASTPANADNGRTLLLVEDEQDVREMTGEQLREMGYRVLEADSGPAALRLVQSGPHIDLLITDIGLPGGMDGHQVVGAVRERIPVLPVIMISGYAAGPTSPDTDLLRKPFHVADLAERVRVKLEARQR